MRTVSALAALVVSTSVAWGNALTDCSLGSPAFDGYCGVGQPGPAGPQGPQGPAGPQGATGPAGPQGAPGAPGAQGPVGETGAQGPAGPQGVQGIQGETGATGATGAAGLNGKDGVDGKDGINGRDFDSDAAIALGAALSMPVWLNPGETGAIAAGIGFAAGEQAIGATGVLRIDGNTSAFAGGAVTPHGAWAGKAGVRVGW
ncbi:MAG: hypothetical protein ACKO0Z_09210 [Betaproteobacteria bacterium]